ncbi:Fluconazole resistance protein 1 [Collariella sp. IMI 366227]|nr:Fluconazole resistance protein 1 [Collariella sp. IMI 366227]
MDGLPTPPNEDLTRANGPKRTHSIPKSVKTVHRPLKRTSTHGHPSSPARDTHSQHSDGRHKRVWKACERCRMKKTKCDGEFPCKRCKDDGLICTAGTRKKTEYKQLPPGYAEVLENSQFVLIATVQKLYSMVRNGDPWDLGEPELNDRGQPIIHNVAAKLGCLRPNNDLDLPVQAIFPEDEASMAELARQLKEQQQKEATGTSPTQHTHIKQETEISSSYTRTDRASSSDVDHSDLEFEPDYRKAAFGTASTVSMSPASLSYSGDFEIPPPSAAPSDGFPPSVHSPTVPSHANFQWMHSRPPSMDYTQQLWMSNQYLEMDATRQHQLMGQYPGAIKPPVFSARNPEVMMGLADPMIYSGYEEDSLQQLFPPPPL